jgi:hypothetical protein
LNAVSSISSVHPHISQQQPPIQQPVSAVSSSVAISSISNSLQPALLNAPISAPINAITNLTSQTSEFTPVQSKQRSKRKGGKGDETVITSFSLDANPVGSITIEDEKGDAPSNNKKAKRAAPTNAELNASLSQPNSWAAITTAQEDADEEMELNNAVMHVTTPSMTTSSTTTTTPMRPTVPTSSLSSIGSPNKTNSTGRSASSTSGTPVRTPSQAHRPQPQAATPAAAATSTANKQ